MRRLLVLSTILLVVLARPAGATTTCSVTVDGRDISTFDTPQHALEVSPDRRMLVSAAILPDTLTAPKADFEVKLEVAGFQIKIGDGSATGLAWSNEVKIGKVADYATGIYKFHANTSFASGKPCNKTAYVRIKGASATKTLVGKVGLFLTLVGVIGAVLGSLRRKRGGPRPVLSIVAMPAGLFGGLGVLLLLQQAGTVFPTRTVAIVGLLGGVLFGIAVPTIVHLLRRNVAT